MCVFCVWYLKLCDFYCREKKLLASTEDFGKDLTGVQNLLKKHQRFEAELDGHDSKVKVR